MIPKLIHRVWIGGDEPEWYGPFRQSWGRVNRQWAVLNWDDRSVETLFPLVNQKLWDHAEEWMPTHWPQFRVDVLRLEILYRLGGVYVDADFEALKPLDDHVKVMSGVWAAWEEQNSKVNNAIIGAEPRSHLIRHMMEVLPTYVDDAMPDIEKNRHACGGPTFWTEMKRLFPEIRVFDKRLFYPYLCGELHRQGEVFPDAVAVHHWANKRRERGLLV